MHIDRFVMVTPATPARNGASYHTRCARGGEWLELAAPGVEWLESAAVWAVEALVALVLDPTSTPRCLFEAEAREAIIRNGGFAVVETGHPADLAFVAKDNCGKIMIIVRGCVPHTWF